VVITADPEVYRESTVHFGQYGLLVPVLDDTPELALHAMDWAAEKVSNEHTPCNQQILQALELVKLPCAFALPETSGCPARCMGISFLHELPSKQGCHPRNTQKHTTHLAEPVVNL
jgi:hypothetical protein